MSCQLCADLEDSNRLLLIEHWEDVQSLRSYLRSESFRVVLSALDCASRPPDVRIDTVLESDGIDSFAALLR